MLFLRGLTRVTRTGCNRYPWVYSSLLGNGQRHLLQPCTQFRSPDHHSQEEQLDPFSLVADELSILANNLRSMVIAKVPKLASAAEYFFKMGVEGKRFRPTVLLLMAAALNIPMPRPAPDAAGDSLSLELHSRQRCIVEITEMIHVASLLHDDVLDDADTRRGIGSLNFVMGNKVVSLLVTVVEHLVTGETMQMTTSSDQRCSMEYYMQKTYYKTASLISNSCKVIALLAGQTTEASILAYEVLLLLPDCLLWRSFPELRTIVDQGFDNSANVDRALEYLGKSQGIERTRELAAKHANLASAAIDSFPENNDKDVQKSRWALVELTHRVIMRTKQGTVTFSQIKFRLQVVL